MVEGRESDRREREKEMVMALSQNKEETVRVSRLCNSALVLNVMNSVLDHLGVSCSV